GLDHFVVQERGRQKCFTKGYRRQRRSGRRRLMRSGFIAGLVWLAAVAAAGPVRAEDASQPPPADAHKACEVPNSLLATESRLPKVTDAVKAGRLDILVIGSRSSTIPGSEPSAYPARLQASLKEALPQVTVNIALEIHPKKTAEEIAGGL